MNLEIRKLFRPSVIIVSLLVFIFIVNLPTPAGLTPQGQKALAIFLVSIFLWVTHALPLMITSLLAVILFPITGVLTTTESYALFGNEAIFFILGAFILASGIMRSGLSTRIALLTLRHFGKSPNFLMLSFLCLSAFLSFWMSEHAVAAMMFPIVLEVVDALKLTPMKSRYGAGLFLSMTWGCIIGGIATFLGGARAPLAIGILHQNTGLRIDFMHWALAALPTVIIMLVVGYFVLIKMFAPEIKNIQQAQNVLKRKQLRMGHVTRREKLIGVLMGFTIFAWIFWGEKFGLANIAIASVVIAFVFQLLDWKEVEEDVNWGIFLMYGGAICLGFAMDLTGAAHWLAAKSFGYFVHSSGSLLISLVIISLFLTEAISNTAAVALLLPLALGLASDFNIDPRVVTLALTIPSGLAFQLPMGTPATAIAYSSGFVSLKDTILGGTILKLIAIILFSLSLFYYWPLIGFNF
ncbi:MAG: DASS family sodium-coupled anion symporter [bacterium]